MYTVFLARYVGDHPAFFDFKRNHSTAKKVEAFQSCLRKAGFRPIVLVTHTGDVRAGDTRVRKMGPFICIIPPIPRCVKGRLLKYLFGIAFSTIFVARLGKRLQTSCFFCWDFLPDTFLPLRMLPKSLLQKVIVDFEESIQMDPGAGRLFRAFEYLAIRTGNYRMIGNNGEAARAMGFELESIFEGFYARSIHEELSFKARMAEKRFESATVIFFSGRIDAVRGALEFLKIAEMLKSEHDMRFIMTGYGDESLIDSIQSNKPHNLELHFNASREDYLNLLFSSDIAFNYLTNDSFASYSFPSKVIEYLMGSVVTLTNHPVALDSNRIRAVEGLGGSIAFIKEYHADRDQQRLKYQPDDVMSLLENFSIRRGAEQLRSVIDG